LAFCPLIVSLACSGAQLVRHDEFLHKLFQQVIEASLLKGLGIFVLKVTALPSPLQLAMPAPCPCGSAF